MILLHDFRPITDGRVRQRSLRQINAYNPCSETIFTLKNIYLYSNAPLGSDKLVIDTLGLYYLKGCQFVKLIEISVNYSAV
jgi:hypothetical protein